MDRRVYITISKKGKSLHSKKLSKYNAYINRSKNLQPHAIKSNKIKYFEKIKMALEKIDQHICPYGHILTIRRILEGIKSQNLFIVKK